MQTNAEVVRQFIGDWSRLDATRLADYFTEDGIYHNMPAEPVQGREPIEQFIAGFMRGWTQTEWEIVNLAEQDEVVYCERLDRTQTQSGNVELPCIGVFYLKDGKISLWRDYFDMSTYVKAIT
ncbi:MAG: limonene-1,2-epoxide hydrolase [Cellvibrionaceae bacterium]|nr:limonene-1,2-epoxide hydrolase [Cellvibrionaceae bacterium]|tara:strand:- start:31085 stop:31453 length:369 start_codon:yes stop_codon:yes gene_type:complete